MTQTIMVKFATAPFLEIYIYIGQEDAGYSCQHLQPTGAAWVRCRADHAPPKGIGHIRTMVTISEGLQLPVKPGVTKA